MTELPLPPDPTPDEVDQGLRVAASFGELLDLIVGGDLSPEQRRSLNHASASMQRAVDGWTEVSDQLAGRPARKPQRGKIPKRGARTRREGPRATVDDVAALAEKLGAAPSTSATPEGHPEAVHQAHDDDEAEQDHR